MSDLAVDDKGNAMLFDQQSSSWKPAPIATNDNGDRMAFDGQQWRSIGAAPSTGAKIADAAGPVGKAVNTGVNWAGTQLIKGVNALLGMPTDVQNLIDSGVSAVEKHVLGIEPPKAPVGHIMPGSADLNKTVFGSLGVPEVNAADNPALTLHNPLGIQGDVNVGSMLDAGAQAIPSALTGGAATAIPAFTGGVASDAAGQAAKGTPYEIPARVLGGVGGFLAGGKLTSPLKADLTPEQARVVQIAKDKGVPLTVGQETGRGRGVESAVSRFPTSQGRMADFADAQNIAVNRAALSEAGAIGDRLDPTSMGGVIKKASNDFEAAKNASGNVTLKPDFYNAAGKAVGDYTATTAPSDIVPMVAKKLDDFFDAKLMKGGNYPELTGQEYQSFRKGLNDTMQNLNPGGGEYRALKGIRNALDDAMEASLPADQAEAWRTVRKNWANLKILTRSAAGGSVDSRAAGNLSPSALSTALRSSQGVDRFATTQGGLNDVARMAGYLADTRPNSGTPQTLQMQHLLTGGGPGALPGYVAGGPMGAVIGSAASMAIPNVVARAMTGSKGFGWLRDYLANQALYGANPQLGNGLRSVPFALVPGGMSSIPALENHRR